MVLSSSVLHHIAVQAIQNSFRCHFEIVEVSLNSLLDVSHIDRHDLIHHPFEFRICKKVEKVLDVYKKDVQFGLRYHSVVSSRYLLVAVGLAHHILEVL